MSLLECHNCTEDATYTGPRNRGTTDVFLPRTPNDRAYIFCSSECRDWWWNVTGHMYFDPDDLRIADDVLPSSLV